MTWARNYGDRIHTGSLETGKRAKKPACLCLGCGCDLRGTSARRCGPCSSEHAAELNKINQKKHLERRKAKA